jgi:amidase
MDSRAYANCDGIELAARIRRGELTANEAISHAYHLIDVIDPQINAFVSREEQQARQEAETPGRGPLAGVPLAMKDCVGFVRAAPRRFGSRLTTPVRSEQDDEVVARYRAAGLIPIGTTNVPEFSSSLTTESRLHGPCRNPWDPSRSVGGSSGGAAAAVAYGAVPIAYGNDSAGSIRVPASCCGVFGFRPSRGRVPLGPHFGEIWYGLFAHHVITRSVRDSAAVLDASVGIDIGAPYGAPEPPLPFSEECLLPPGRLRIAVSDGARQGFSLDPECSQALFATVELLERLGHDVRPGAPRYSGAELMEGLTRLISVALAEEVPALAAESRKRIGPDTVEACHRMLIERGRRISALELSKTLSFKSTLGRTVGRFFMDYDVLLTPTLARPPLPLGTLNADSDDLDSYLDCMWRTSPFAPLANFCGLPSMSVPLQWTGQNLPLGMLFTAPYVNDAALFRLAHQLERAQPWCHKHPPISAWALAGD